MNFFSVKGTSMVGYFDWLEPFVMFMLATVIIVSTLSCFIGIFIVAYAFLRHVYKDYIIDKWS